MKKFKLLLVFSLCSFYLLNAQEKTTMIGITTSYEVFIPDIENYYYYESTNNRAFSYGIEYSEKKGMFAYRAGVSYTRLKDQMVVPSDGIYLIDINIGMPPIFEPLEILDFPISGQIYLGKKKFKAYGTVGVASSLTFHKYSTFNGFYSGEEEAKTVRNFSFRGIYGLGLTYQFGKHIGLDLSVSKKRNLYTIDDYYLKPRDVKYSFQTTINYIF